MNHDRAISGKAKNWIKSNINIKFKLVKANPEITTESNTSVAS